MRRILTLFSASFALFLYNRIIDTKKEGPVKDTSYSLRMKHLASVSIVTLNIIDVNPLTYVLGFGIMFTC